MNRKKSEEGNSLQRKSTSGNEGKMRKKREDKRSISVVRRYKRSTPPPLVPRMPSLVLPVSMVLSRWGRSLAKQSTMAQLRAACRDSVTQGRGGGRQVAGAGQKRAYQIDNN